MAAKDLSGINTLQLWIYASRTGANIKFGLHDTGGTTTELTPTVNTANTWEMKTWDLSGVSNANKDAIDTLIITVVNADAANTFYIDGFATPADVDVNVSSLDLALALKGGTVQIDKTFDGTVLALGLTLHAPDITSSYTAGEPSALTLTLHAPTITLDSDFNATVLALVLTAESGTYPSVITRIIRKTYFFGATEQVTATKLNNFIDTAVWEISDQAAGDMVCYDGTNWVRIPKGTAGQMLTMGASVPAWA